MQFLNGILELDAQIHVTLMQPMDPFGNLVDREGNSLDGRGRVIATDRYLRDAATGELSTDVGRDREYTRLLGLRISDAFRRGNTIMQTHVVSFAVFEELRRLNPGLDLYRLLRTGGTHESLRFSDVVTAVERVCEALRDMECAGKIRLTERLRGARADDVVHGALRALGTYHSKPALERLGDRLYHRDRNLLFYYHNRLRGYGLEANA
jgi:glycerol-3-phosphate O-acyltransferase